MTEALALIDTTKTIIGEFCPLYLMKRYCILHIYMSAKAGQAAEPDFFKGIHGLNKFLILQPKPTT